MIRIIPVITFCQYDETPDKLKPFCNTPINKTPNAVPITPPRINIKLMRTSS